MRDWIGIHIEVPCVDFEKLSDSRRGESSDAIRARMEAAREMQRQRSIELEDEMMTHADMRVAEVCQFCELDDTMQKPVKIAMTQHQLSAQLAEAIQHRLKGMMV